MPLISVIIPYYNTPLNALKRCIHPFLTQSYEEVEVILVDDCSTQQYSQSITELISTAKTSMMLAKTPHNGGQNYARNTGIRMARGTYIAFLDSDDYYDMTEFEKVIDVVRLQESRLYCFNAVAVDATGKELYMENAFLDSDDYYDMTEFEKVIDVVRLQESRLYCFNAVAVDATGKELYMENIAHEVSGPSPMKQSIRKAAALWNWVIDANLFKQNSLNTSLRIGEDLVSIIPILANADNVIPINAAPYRYVQHLSSMMKRADTEDRAMLIKGFDTMLNEHQHELAPYRDEIEWQAIWHILFWEPLQILQQQPHMATRYYRQAHVWMDNVFPQWRQNPYLRTDSLAQETRFHLITKGHYMAYRTLHSVTSLIHNIQS